MTSAHLHDTGFLLARAKAGDVMAEEQLFDRHRDRLRQMFRYRMDADLSTRVDASDVVQEALATAHARLPQYLEHPQIDFYPWLGRITWNRRIDLHRHHVTSQRCSVHREVAGTAALPDDPATCLADRLVDRDISAFSRLARHALRLQIRAALAKLPTLAQEVLALRFLEQLTVRESAQMIGVTEGTLKARQLPTLVRLRDLLDGMQETS